jgi:hypothetical protein
MLIIVTLDLSNVKELRSLHLTLPYDRYLKQRSMGVLCNTLRSAASSKVSELSVSTKNDPHAISWSCLGRLISENTLPGLRTMNVILREYVDSSDSFKELEDVGEMRITTNITSKLDGRYTWLTGKYQQEPRFHSYLTILQLTLVQRNLARS